MTSRSRTYTSEWYANHFTGAFIKRNARMFPHFIFPYLSQTSVENKAEQTFELFPWQSTHPIPLGFVEPVHPFVDPLHRLVRQKHKYDNELILLKNRYEATIKDKKRMKKMALYNARGSGDVNFNYIAKFGEMIKLNPDEYFNGTYNWYFTGSNCKWIRDDDNIDWLLHTGGGSNMNLLNMSRLQQHVSVATEDDNDILNIDIQPFDSVNEHLIDHGHIFELRTTDNSSLLSVRQRSAISILDPKSRSMVYQLKQSADTSCPFVSGSFERQSSLFITSDGQRCVKLWDGSKCITESSLFDESATLPDNWSCVRGFQPKIFAYADRFKVGLFDTRLDQWSQQDAQQGGNVVMNIKKLMNACEQIVNVDVSQVSPNVLYVATTHKLFGIDVRCVRTKKFATIEWSHQMLTYPTNMAFAQFTETDCNEIIVLSGSKPDEIKLAHVNQISSGGVRWNSSSCPYRSVGIAASYRLARLRGFCLDPMSMAENEINISSTGLTAIGRHLIVQNAAGHLFTQRFIDRSSKQITDEKLKVANAIHLWDTQLMSAPSSLQSHKYKSTDISNVRGMANVLARNISNPHGIGGSGVVDVKSAEVESDLPRQTCRWQYSVSQLQHYKDALAADMLAVWDIIPDNERGTDPTAVPGSATDRLTEWLSKSATTVFDPEDMNMNDSFTAQTQMPLDTSTQSAHVDDETRNDSVQLSAANRSMNRKKNKARRTFIVGF